MIVLDLDLTVFSIESNKMPVVDVTDEAYYYPIYPAALKWINSTKDRLCIASRSRYKQRCLNSLEHAGVVLSRFDHMVIKHTDKHLGKIPHLKEIHQVTGEALNNLILIDDDLINVKSARSMGCLAVLVSKL